MKLVLNFFFAFIFLINISSTTSANELNKLQDTLTEIGVNQEYSENIINYIENLSITEAEFNSILNTKDKITNKIGDKNSLSDFNLSDMSTLYSDVMTIAKALDLGVSYNFFDKYITVKDKSNNEILFSGNVEELKDYYNNLTQTVSSMDIQTIEDDLIAEITTPDDNYINRETDNKTKAFSKEEVATKESSNSKVANKSTPNNKLATNSTLVATKGNLFQASNVLLLILGGFLLYILFIVIRSFRV